MLKIAYVNLRLVPLPGADNKNEYQASAVLGVKDAKMEVFILNAVKEYHSKNLHYVKFPLLPSVFKYLNYIFTFNFNRFKLIEKNINLNDFDYIILRYPKADKSGIRFCKRHKVITEHHANEMPELLLEFKENKNIAIKIAKILRYTLEKVYGKKIIPHLKGQISVTKSIASYQKGLSQCGVKGMVIPNGIGVDSITYSKYKRFNNVQLDIVFIASADLPFQGLDRILNSIDNYKGGEKITLHLIGPFFDIKYKKYDFVKIHGILNRSGIDEVMRACNIGVGTLGLFRGKMDEAASLKTRDYITRGLPFILAYKDTDLVANPPEKKFFLEFPNDDSPIDMQKIIDFVKEINEKYEVDELAGYMREYAKKHLEWKIKMQQYIDFVKQIDEDEKAS